MTDQSQPDQPDGGRLLPCPFCGPGNSMVDPWYDDVSKRWAVGCGGCGSSSGRSVHAEGSKEAAIKSWNTRGLTPTRDGAEPTPQTILLRQARDYIRQYIKELGGCDHLAGICCCADIELAGRIEAVVGDGASPLPSRDGAESAAESAGLLRGWAKAYRDTPEHRFPSDPNAEFFPIDLERAADLLSAPPKPAPDAMREALQKIADYRLPARGEARYADEVVRMRGIASAALAAPVPPPDGVSVSDNLSDAREFCAGAFGPFGVDIEPYAKIVSALLDHAVERHCRNGNTSPPCAVAAEPTERELVDAEIARAKEQDAAISASEVEFMDKLRATPPVRGERDKFYAVLANCLPQEMIDDIWRDIEEAGVFIPVQPGAGNAKTILYGVSKKYISQENIDQFWQEVKEAGIFSVQTGAGERETEPDLCAGGVNPGWEECPKCGATMDDECKAPKSTAKTCLDDIGLKITTELYKAVSGHTGDACLLAMIGSWGDTLDDPDILAGLQRYNEMGECFIPAAASRQAPPSSSEGGR